MLKSKVLFDSFIIIEKVGINVEFSETNQFLNSPDDLEFEFLEFSEYWISSLGFSYLIFFL